VEFGGTLSKVSIAGEKSLLLNKEPHCIIAIRDYATILSPETLQVTGVYHMISKACINAVLTFKIKSRAIFII
jgi:hypothetical protein